MKDGIDGLVVVVGLAVCVELISCNLEIRTIGNAFALKWRFCEHNVWRFMWKFCLTYTSKRKVTRVKLS